MESLLHDRSGVLRLAAVTLQALLRCGPCTCTLRIITTGLPGRPSQEQKGLAERVLMAPQRLSHPW